ncbi:nucleotide-diphospho-sugar transferase [Piromyces finnis]|uniref:Nucleotide-diphospho-sugar transferase n=1 Tax=Piromyces finnis TaxID=1754191 RepID=A0A1Y1V903_9FUNG|nr:nucleotide-diphospho-sugar transferase [Piromyces finnis]|eukprot:ORX48902.1 nucleotide-diphospho-sugar transferase [Piromyces finnis]
MSSENNYQYNEVEDDEAFLLENINLEESKNDIEEALINRNENGKKNSKFNIIKSLKRNKAKIIKINVVILIILFIAYTVIDICNRDENYVLRKYVKVEDSYDANDNYDNWNNNTGNKNAFLVMLTSEGNSVDNYYMYTSTIVYRLLHKEETRTRRDDVDVVIMVTEDVADWKLRGLHNLGAVIKRVNKIRMGTNYIINRRWRNCYTKLHMFEMTEYDTIVYLDADLFIKKNIDELFDIANDVRNTTGRNDFFGAVTDGSIKINYNNRERKGMLNAGIMILTPEMKVYNDLIELAPKKELYNSGFMEQGLLSYYYSDFNNQFNRTRYHLDARYNAQWLDESAYDEYYDKVYIIHQKIGNIESSKSKQVQKNIFNSIVEWISYVNNEKLDISYD